MQISELFLWGRNCLHFGNTLLQGREHLRAEPQGKRCPSCRKACAQSTGATPGRSPRQLLCLSLTSCFWTGLRINFWTPVKSKSSDTPGRCPSRVMPSGDSVFPGLLFCASWPLLFHYEVHDCTKESTWSVQMCFGARRPQAGCILQHRFFESATPGEDVL